VEVVAPRVEYRTPPAAPETQKAVPSLVTAPRILFPVDASDNFVVISIDAFASILATTRLTVEDAVPAIDAVPGATPYPATVR